VSLLDEASLLLHDEAIRLLETGSVEATEIGTSPLSARELLAAVARACIVAAVHQKGLLWYWRIGLPSRRVSC
jgi:hypothetical protein